MENGNDRAGYVPPAESDPSAVVAPAPSDDAHKPGDAGNTPEPAKPEQEVLPPVPAGLDELRKGLLRSYNNKMQALNSERKDIAESKKKAELFDKLAADERFQKWYRSGQQSASQEPRSPEEITPEKLEAAAADPKAFATLVQQMVQQGIQQAIAPVQQTVEEREAQAMLAQEYRDARTVGGDDFIAAHTTGALKPYYDDGLTMRQAYASYLLDKKSGATTPTPETSAATQPPGRSAGSGEPMRTVKVKTLAEAMDVSFAARQKGQKIKVELEK